MSSTSSQPQVLHLVEPTSATENIKAAYAKTSATALGWIHVLCGVVTLAADIPLILLPSYFDSGDCYGFSSRFAYDHYFTGVWTSALFLVSGVVAILGARTGNKFLVLATVVVSIVSTLGAVVLIVISITNFGIIEGVGRRYSKGLQNYEDYLNKTSDYGNYEDYHNEASEFGNYSDPDSDYLFGMHGIMPCTPHNLSSFTLAQNKVQSAVEVSEAAFGLQIFSGLVLLVCALASSMLPCRPLCFPPRKSSMALNSIKFSLGEVNRVEMVAAESGKVEEGGDYHKF